MSCSFVSVERSYTPAVKNLPWLFDHASFSARNFVCTSFCYSIRGRSFNFQVSFTPIDCRFGDRMGPLSFAGDCRRHVIK